MSYEEFNWKSSTKTRYYYTRVQMKWVPKQNKCMIYFIINVDTCIVNIITHVQTKVYNRQPVGRSSADIRRLSADGSLIKCHRPTVWRSSADQRPMIGRPSAYIMMKESPKSRPIVGRSSGDHCRTLHRWQNPWKSADRSTKLLTWVLRQKKVVGRPKILPKSVPTSADNRPTSPDFPIFGSPTVGRPSVWVMWL